VRAAAVKVAVQAAAAVTRAAAAAKKKVAATATEAVGPNKALNNTAKAASSLQDSLRRWPCGACTGRIRCWARLCMRSTCTR
jgi:hypothetical protein